MFQDNEALKIKSRSSNYLDSITDFNRQVPFSKTTSDCCTACRKTTTVRTSWSDFVRLTYQTNVDTENNKKKKNKTLLLQ